jgi:hypothetical protein
MSAQQTVDIVAYMLQVGKFPAGKTELAADEAALKSVAMAQAGASGAAKATLLAAQAASIRATGNLNEVMRGILFPSSNLVFTVQTTDPSAPRNAAPAERKADAGFSFTDWGATMYTPWEMVDYAAIAVAESAALLLIPGRLCENGRPVPVDRADWIKFSLEMAEAGRASYKASQSRNQEAVSESTNQLAESCSNCHRVYRDVQGGKAARCQTR